MNTYFSVKSVLLNMLNNPRGSLWRKWDLHVHTPASIVQHYGRGDDAWEKFFAGIEALPEEFKVIGINDYIFIDGYTKVKEAHSNGRMQNIALFLPVIELRLDKFGQSGSKLSCVNYHVIFSDKVEPDDIQEFFLNKLSVQYNLSEYPEEVTAKKVSLENFGRIIRENTPQDKRDKLAVKTNLEIGFNNFHLPIKTINDALEGSLCFRSKYMTAVGKAEWEDIRFGQSGQGTAEKKTIINNADLVFTAGKSVGNAQLARQSLISQQVNSKLFDCSDAHHFSDSQEHIRLGHCFTWIKADTTFEGLKLASQRYDDRVCIAREPLKVSQVNRNKTKYIKSLEIRKLSGAITEETWFDCEIEFNHDLVAIIGNKGNGKSALTDIIALCGNTKVPRLSFLTENRFCNSSQKKAEGFEAKLIWESGLPTPRKLSDKIPTHENELVRYVPQSFFESVTNEVAIHENSEFDMELKKVIFSHIPESEHLGFEDLDKLIEHHVKTTEEDLSSLRQNLHRLNTEICKIESEISEEKLRETAAQIEIREKELESHNTAQPPKIEKPATQSEQADKLESCRSEVDKLETQNALQKEALSNLKRRRLTLHQIMERVQNVEKYVQSSLQNLTQDLDEVDVELELNTLIQLSIDLKPLGKHLSDTSSEILVVEGNLDSDSDGSLAHQLQSMKTEASSLQDSLNEADEQYQRHLSDLQSWNNRRDQIIGSEEAIGSLKYLQKKLDDQRNSLPKKHEEMLEERLNITRSIYIQISKLKRTLEELSQFVQDRVSQHELTREKYGFSFNVRLTYLSFVERFLEFIDHGRSGTFRGREAGRDILVEICKKYDFYVEDNVISFVEEVVKKLKQDDNYEPPRKMDVSTQLKRAFTELEVYDFLFGLEYIRPNYSLQLDEKEMQQLSPGERGVLLLIFYLLVDKDECPLLIDQPEENLDNQSVYKLLVPAIKEAKNKRQIFLVTHNPNLAIVCDAEQIIHASMDKNDGNRIDYQSGAIENPIFNTLALDILEGTQPAFDIRRETYVFPISSTNQ